MSLNPFAFALARYLRIAASIISISEAYYVQDCIFLSLGHSSGLLGGMLGKLRRSNFVPPHFSQSCFIS